MTMVSYAQNHEDVLLDRVFPRGAHGFYIDVGANDPVNDSVTKHFYDLGWCGINVEPSTEPFGRLQEQRERDINLNVGLGDAAGELTFYEFPHEVSGLSTFSAEQADWHREAGWACSERAVKVTTLAEICATYVGDRTVDLLSIDVEGHERHVLEGGDWARWRPRVIVVEAVKPHTRIPTHEDWEGVLLGHGYLAAAFDGLNRYYVRPEDEALAGPLAVPVNVTDAYLPYKFLMEVQAQRNRADAAYQQVAAVRAVNASLKAEVEDSMELVARVMADLTTLRAEFEKVERVLGRVRPDYEAVRTAVAEAADENATAIAIVSEAHTQVQAARALNDVLGPMGIDVGRRITGLSKRFPAVASPAKRALRAALRLWRRPPG